VNNTLVVSDRARICDDVFVRQGLPKIKNDRVFALAAAGEPILLCTPTASSVTSGELTYSAGDAPDFEQCILIKGYVWTPKGVLIVNSVPAADPIDDALTS